MGPTAPTLADVIPTIVIVILSMGIVIAKQVIWVQRVTYLAL